MISGEKKRRRKRLYGGIYGDNFILLAYNCGGGRDI